MDTSSPMNTHEPLEMSERGAGIVCPRCREETRFAELFGIKVVACPFCLGFMTQGCEFRHLVETLRKQYRGPNQLNGPLDALQLHHVCQCTVCGSQMDTHPFAGPGAVVIDSCPHCKLVWLDCGELLRIKRAPGRR